MKTNRRLGNRGHYLYDTCKYIFEDLYKKKYHDF